MEGRDQGIEVRHPGSGSGGWGRGELVWLACVFTLSLSPAMANDGKSEESNVSIDVRVYNYSPVAAGVLEKAESRAAGFFHAAGVGVKWFNCKLPEDSRCATLLDPSHVGVRIISDVSLAPGSTRRTMGYAVGDMATVSLCRVQEEAAEYRVDLGAVLGPALAHEIGHLLLGPEGHTATGIMRVHWRREDYERAPRGAFKFTLRQAQAIRAEVAKRLQAQAAVELPTNTAPDQER